MKELIILMARALVDYPDQVLVREIVGNQTKVLELEVAKADVGKVIGRQGRTAQAMRTILGAASAKGHVRTVLEIVDQKRDRADFPKLHTLPEAGAHIQRQQVSKL